MITILVGSIYFGGVHEVLVGIDPTSHQVIPTNFYIYKIAYIYTHTLDA